MARTERRALWLWLLALCAFGAMPDAAFTQAPQADAQPRRTVVSGVPREGQGEDVHVLLPGGTHAPGSLSVIVALHGRGEAVRGPARGARGWLDDYALERAFVVMTRGRPISADAAGLASPAQLSVMTRALRARPFRAIAVVMPYTPDLIDEAPGSDRIAAYGRWLLEVMLPAVRTALPEIGAEPSRTAIDGVSLGGMLALDIGLRHPESFGSVGGIQAAVRGRVGAYGPLATGATRCLRLASSERDPFLRATRELSSAWRARGIVHELVEYAGPHGYAFNRGPGALELLRFHHGCFSR